MHDPTPPPNPYGRGWPAAQRGANNQPLRLTHADRDSVANLLKEAYAEGRLDTDEFEERLEAAMRAKVHGELEPLLSDLLPEGARIPEPPAAQRSPPASGSERATALVGHCSGYFLAALGPLAVLLVSGNSSAFVRKHALEALNFQLTFVVGSLVLWFFFWLILPLVAWVFLLLGWVVLPMIAGLAALSGGSWKYPFTWRPIKDD